MSGRIRMPAEWEPHEGTLLTWPHDLATWRGLGDEIEWAWQRLAALLSDVGDVHVNVPPSHVERVRGLLERGGATMERVVLHPIDSDDVWARDHGPTIVHRETAEGRERVMIDWIFNAWGDKFPSSRDREVTRQLAERWGWAREAPGLVMEGGALEVNGAGDLLTTESVLLNPNRNPTFSRDELLAELKRWLGVERIHWLRRGIEGDDTDGHIDDLARFVSERTIVTVCTEDASHPDYTVLQENRETLRGLVGPGGRGFEVLDLPVPEPIVFQDEHLPASYANFYVTNGLVIVPVFDQPTDAQALATLRDCFPARRVEGLDARAIVSQYGAIHCVTQQIPVA
jgi:agmatine deiminase